MATNTNGLIYYKLDAYLHGYPGDTTKNCGLKGEEIDGNFNFLRGNDIKEITIDDKGTILLSKYNGEVLSATPTNGEYDFKYDSTKGTLTITSPDGTETTLDGFKIGNTIYHDYSLVGAGTQDSPLAVANVIKTGRYSPAIRLIDIIEGELLPTENNAKNDRYVTREKMSHFGMLYPLSGVQTLKEFLTKTNSEWRIPTKADWDELLNSIDCDVPNHGSMDSNVVLGNNAGRALKSNRYWETNSKGELLADDIYGFSIFPVGYADSRGVDYYGGFGKWAAFWTDTAEDKHNDMYIKIFDYEQNGVKQNTWGEDCYLSLRLVKDYKNGNNFSQVESINGASVNCIHIPGQNLVWTKENVYIPNTAYKGYVPEAWTDFEGELIDENNSNIRYFINEWTGTDWAKHEIKEGEGIVLYESEDGRMHEWLLMNGELVDSAVIIKSEFEAELKELTGRLEREINDRDFVDKQIWASLEEEATNRVNTESLLWESINNEIVTRETVDNEQWDAIKTETETRQTVDNEQWAVINNEISVRENTDNAIITALTNEVTARDAVDKEIWAALKSEIELREVSDESILGNIDAEVEAREEVEAELWKAINNETVARETVDTQQWVAINGIKEELGSKGDSSEKNTLYGYVSGAYDAASEASNMANDNAEALNVLRGNVTSEGSVKEAIFESIVGPTLTDVTEANQSLLRKYTIDGEPYFYASNLSADIMHENRGLDTVLTEITNSLSQLTATVAELTTKVSSIETTLATLEGEVNTLKATAITGIQGTSNEIKVDVNQNVATIGFDDDAHFIAG